MYGSIKLKNFRCFDNHEIIFRDGRNKLLNNIHFIGENATGKSSILSAFSFIKELTLLNYNMEVSNSNRLKDKVQT